ncbi:MAG: hypothetical protein ACREJ6_10475 [Candidatus Methylomirabilis sp.]
MTGLVPVARHFKERKAGKKGRGELTQDELDRRQKAAIRAGIAAPSSEDLTNLAQYNTLLATVQEKQKKRTMLGG